MDVSRTGTRRFLGFSARVLLDTYFTTNRSKEFVLNSIPTLNRRFGQVLPIADRFAERLSSQRDTVLVQDIHWPDFSGYIYFIG